MSYHYGTETLDELNKACPGTAYLRKVIRHIVHKFGADHVTVIAYGEIEETWDRQGKRFKPSEVMAMSQWSVEIDGVISINFSKDGKKVGSLFVLYDGPYHVGENSEEIINDYSVSLGDLPDPL